MSLGRLPMLCLGVFSVAYAASTEDLLASALNSHPKTALSAMQRVRIARGGVTNEYRLLVEQDGTGCARYEVLAPVRHRGMVLLEDHQKQTRFDPVSNCCEIQHLSRAVTQGIFDRRRPALIKSNYRLASLGETTIGGRKARVIAATPIADGSLRRTYWLDAQRNVVLKMRVYAENNSVLYERELLYPSFEPRVTKETFEARFGCGVHVVEGQPPKLFGALSKLSADVGFDILTPQQLPDGLAFLYGESLITSSGKTAVLRYSDGLAQASVYQVKSTVLVPSAITSGGADRTAVFSRHGSKYTIVGDLGESGMSRLVAGFEKADKLRQRRWASDLARQLHAPQAEVHKLLDEGLDLRDAAFLLVVREQSREQLARLREWWLEGMTKQEIVNRSRADWSQVQERIRTVGFSN